MKREKEQKIAYELLGMLQKGVEYEWHLGREESTSQYGINSSGLGRILFEARNRACMTQASLSANTGISQPLISRIERNLESPSLLTLSRLAEGLGMTLNVEFV